MRRSVGRVILATGWLCASVWVGAEAASLVPGTWETTARVMTPNGEQTMHEMVCQRGGQIDSLLMRQQGAACAPWQAGAPNAAGEQLFTAQCTQSGAVPGLVLPFTVHARVKIAPNGRSVSGSVVATGSVNGLSFNSPPTPFTARFVRSSCSVGR